MARVAHQTDRIAASQEAHEALHEAQVNSQARERLLQSLKFPNFNERRNQVTTPFTDTLKWVFAGDENDDSDEAANSAETDSSGQHEDHAQASTDVSKINWSSFSNWLKSTDSIYWISGKPGSGKTTLIKYIVAHKHTRNDLDIWSPGCVIVSHFFWRPGTSMQKSLKGLFCSLLFQLLDSSDAAFRQVISSRPGRKDCHTDWSTEELESALETAIAACDGGVCLFLDGIDEIQPGNGTEPDIPEFLKWAIELSKSHKIKLCLASRPDPVILEEELSQYPRLRLHDLNREDLMEYAGTHLDFSKGISLEHDGVMSMMCNPLTEREIISLLVAKAEGVFLWLVLATRSINEGIRYRDTADLLKKRIDRLPSDLHSLYEDMWGRFSALSLPEYRKNAALYYKVLIESSEHNFVMTIVDLTVATTSIADAFFYSFPKLSTVDLAETLLQECEEVEKRLENYCVGLVETRPLTKGRPMDSKGLLSEVGLYSDKDSDMSSVHHHSHLQFIHRTAKDFLTDTDAGRKILSFDKTSHYRIHYLILRGKLISLALCFSGSNLSEFQQWLHTFRVAWETTDQWVSNDWERLLVLLLGLALTGRLVYGTHKLAHAPDRAVLLNGMIYDNVDDRFVMSLVKAYGLSQKEKSELLLVMCRGKENIFDNDMSVFRNFWNRRTNWEPDPSTFRALLNEGADPNWRGWARVSHIFGAVKYAIVETPWQRFLLHAFCTVARLNPSFKSKGRPYLALIVDIIALFDSSAANLDTMITMAIHSDRLEPDCGETTWLIGEIEGFANDLPSTDMDTQDTMLVSMPAHTIIKYLTTFVRNQFSCGYLGEGNSVEELLRSCKTLERACADPRRRSEKDCQVLGLFRYNYSRQGSTRSWFEAKDEAQSRFASRLLQSIQEWASSSGTFTLDAKAEAQARSTGSFLESVQKWAISSDPHHLEDDFGLRVMVGDVFPNDTMLPISTDESWILKDRRSTEEFPWEILEKLGMTLVRPETGLQAGRPFLDLFIEKVKSSRK